MQKIGPHGRTRSSVSAGVTLSVLATLMSIGILRFPSNYKRLMLKVQSEGSRVAVKIRAAAKSNTPAIFTKRMDLGEREYAQIANLVHLGRPQQMMKCSTSMGPSAEEGVNLSLIHI